MCIEQAPVIAEIYAKNRSRGLQILGISLDDERAAMETFREEHGQTWPTSFTGLRSRKDPVARIYRAPGVGVIYVVDRDGIFRGMHHSPDDLAAFLEPWLAAPASP